LKPIAYVVLAALNLFDFAMTLWGVSSGYFVEMNPAMALLIHVSPWAFFVYKLIVTNFGLVLLRSLEAHRKMKNLMYLLLGFYAGVALLHCWNAWILLTLNPI
jgi:uncharacterized membrane protein